MKNLKDLTLKTGETNDGQKNSTRSRMKTKPTKVPDSDLEDEECRKTFPTKGDLEKQYFLPPSISVPDGKTETETEIEIKEEGEEALPDEEEPIRREEGQDDI